MTDPSIQTDWLEQTWEIKRNLAEQYAGVSASEALARMRESVREEWVKRGWNLLQRVPPHTHKGASS